jgi:UDP-N-acetylglucosamine/UDP-N-acetylgalactosamine diphosphorylase
MNYDEALAKLNSINQSHLLCYWDELGFEEKAFLLRQIEDLDVDTVRKQQNLLKNPPSAAAETLEPFVDFSIAGQTADEMLGKKSLAQGLMGCLIVAGGQGTRLHFDGPKGMYPITNIRKKSLFQLFSEKVLAAGKQVQCPLSVAIMTSPLNHGITLTYFEAHGYFGLKEQQIDFFMQNTLPFLDDKGNLFLENKDSIAQGPDGNGSSLHNFWNQGLFSQWKEKGIEYLNFILIDNPLADPFDAELLGFHIRNKNDITVKCTLKSQPDEKVGVLVKQDKKVKVIEYTEMPEKDRKAMTADGHLKYGCANISLFCISLSFLERLFSQKVHLPLHAAYKAAPSLDHKDKMAWKFEYFIFDILPLAEKVQALLYPRDHCFAPLKNLTGADSPNSVQAALQLRDQKIYEELFGSPIPQKPFELAQDFYYPIPFYIERWKNKPLSNDHYLGGI